MPKVIQFRSTPELDALIDGELQALKAQRVPRVLANRSVVVRSILAQNLADGGKREMSQEMIKRVWFILQKSLGVAVPKVLAEMQAEAEAEMAEIEDSWDESEGAEPAAAG
jgi:hypothetical protein